MKNTIRQIYFYAATLIFLIMSVIALISLLNLGMRTYVFPKADQAYGQTCDEMGRVQYAPGVDLGTPAVPPTNEESDAKKAACEKSLAEQRSAQHQRDLVQWLSMLIVAAPLFWVHFKWVQKERETELAMSKDEKKA